MTKKKFFCSFFLLMALSLGVHAQSAAKPFVMHTMYLNGNLENQNTNLDSLLKVYKQHVLDPNSYFASSKIIRHWWGHDSREVTIITELKNLDDLEKAFEKQNELLKQYTSSSKNFAHLWAQAFSPEHHSDEIYRVIE
ncbi:MAG: hypothetical protein ACTHMD_08980 [Flavisolibacter sp.]